MSPAGSSHTSYYPPGTFEYMDVDQSPLDPTSTASTQHAKTWSTSSRRMSSASDSEMPPLLELNNPAISFDPSADWSIGTSPLIAAVAIDGRDAREEADWWDADLRASQARPGPGMLPSMALSKFIDPSVPMYSVNYKTPTVDLSPRPRTESAATSPSIPSPPPFNNPSTSELQYIRPHRDAFFIPSTNEWILVAAREGPLPPAASSFLASQTQHFPDSSRRGSQRTCRSSSNPPNHTHHFHLYRDAITTSSVFSGFLPSKDGIPIFEGEQLLDLVVCCQCSLYCVRSKPLPGILPRESLTQLIEEKKSNPALGKTGNETALAALEVLLKAIENNIWRGETRPLSTTGKGFQKLGWNHSVIQIFTTLHYVLPRPGDESRVVEPPRLDGETPASARNRVRFLRTWLELTAVISSFVQINAITSSNAYALAVDIKDTRYTITEYFSELVATDTRLISADIASLSAWETLGLLPKSLTSDSLEFAYRAQCRCDPAHTPIYLTCIRELSEALAQSMHHVSSNLQSLLATEYSRGKWTTDRIPQAAEFLGFGKDGALKLEWNGDIDDSFAISAWKDAVKRTWSDATNGSSRRRDLKEAMRILGEDRGSKVMLNALTDQNVDIDPEQAYRILEVPADVPEDMLIMVYQMRVDERPSQLKRMRSAMSVITEHTKSQRLHTFMDTGFDPGDQKNEHPLEWPRGLNQLGNTCYLNSLLQYFYTIDALRESITSVQTFKDNKIAASITKCRVGGRHVTVREVERSRRFVSQLADLFKDLEFSKSPAITPSLELAKLALVTSKDEEEDEALKPPPETDSSESTDATLVEEPAHQMTSSRGSPTNATWGEGPEPAPASSLPETQVRMEVDNEQTSSRTSGPPALPPRKKTTRIIPESSMMFGKQHDVAECMDNCLFQIEAALLGDGAESSDTSRVVKSLFFGKQRQRFTPKVQESVDAEGPRIKDDVFSHLPITVTHEGLDLYDGLNNYFEDTVELEGKAGSLEMSLLELPPILQIQLQRVQFDRKSGQAFKSLAYVKFEEELFMDRFLETASQEKRAKSRLINSRVRSYRERIDALSSGESASYGAQLGRSAAFLAKLAGEPAVDVEGLDQHLNMERNRLTDLISSLQREMQSSKLEMEALWADERKAEYELTSVFIHRGSSALWGHYFFFTRHLPDAPDSWFKMNDSDVSIVSKEEVLADPGPSTANAYLLVYARKGSNVIHTVKRDSFCKDAGSGAKPIAPS